MGASSAEERLREQISRLYELYERKAGRFHTALIGVTSLVTVVFVLVFYPYATFRGQTYALEAELEELEGELARARFDVEESDALLREYLTSTVAALSLIGDFRIESLAYAAAEHDLELAALRSKIGDDARLQASLREAAAGREISADLLQQYEELAELNERPCFWRSGEAWTRCMLKQHLDQAHSEATRSFGYRRTIGLHNELVVPAYRALEALSASFGAFLLGSEMVWRVESEAIKVHLPERTRSYLGHLAEPIVEVADGLGAQYGTFASSYREILTVHHETLQLVGNDLKDAARRLDETQKEVEAELATVAARLEDMKGWQEIETPFGTLPIGLNELTLLFPVLMAAGFMLCSSLFVESLLLRREFHGLTRATDPEGVVLPDERIALIAPLWIDPLQPRGHRIYRASILALPVIAYLAAIGLLLHNQLLAGPFLREARLNIVIYAILYLGSAAVIVEGVRRVWRALRRYEGALPSSLPQPASSP